MTRGAKPAEAARGVIQSVRAAIAEGDALTGFRAEVLHPRPPDQAARQIAGAFDEPASPAARAQIIAKPEDVEIEQSASLFGDIPDEAAPYEAARQRLIGCVPGAAA